MCVYEVFVCVCAGVRVLSDGIACVCVYKSVIISITESHFGS